MPHHLVAFLLVVAVLTVTPGPDMALVLRNGVRGGVRLAWWTGLGCCAGITVHATLAVVGLSAILAASAAAYTALRIAGGVYLIYLGAMAVVGSFRAHETLAAPQEASKSRGAAFRQGVLSNILNPKIALLFLTLLPQFIGESEPRLTTSALLAATFLGIAVLWWRLFSLGVGALGAVLSRTRVRVVFERVTGVVLTGLGIRVVVTG